MGDYSCPTCGKQYKRLNSFMVHRKNEHGWTLCECAEMFE